MESSKSNADKLTNDFGYLKMYAEVGYTINDKKTQFLTMKITANYFVTITVPNGIFEWFYDVKDFANNELMSYWDECYGEPEDKLIECRRQRIEDFIQFILTHDVRVVMFEERNKQKHRLEFMKDNDWFPFEFLEL
jgi:hypothetical protein